MSRVSGKLMEFWLSADATAATNSDKIAYVRTSGFSGTAPITNVTAAGDGWQRNVKGIPGATASVAGVLDKTTPSGKFQLEDALADDVARGFAIVPVGGTGDEGDAISGNALVSSLQYQGSYDGSWTFNAQLTADNTVTFSHAGP